MITRVYILGPMRGIPYYNFPAFDAAEDRLDIAGLKVVSPAAIDREAGLNPYWLPTDQDWNQLPPGQPLDAIIDRDLIQVRKCDAYVTLGGWENSVGARAEKALLDWQGAVRLDLDTLKPWAEPIKLNYPECVVQPTAAASATGEIRITDPKTGGQKGQKLQRFDLIPCEPLTALAEVYGRGAKKYSPWNWAKGYAWTLSFGALNRHLWAWWGGETLDSETGNHHLACVAWHAFTLWWFQKHARGTDDRLATILSSGKLDDGQRTSE